MRINKNKMKDNQSSTYVKLHRFATPLLLLPPIFCKGLPAEIKMAGSFTLLDKVVILGPRPPAAEIISGKRGCPDFSLI